MIELKSVSKVFQTKDIETRALDDICLKINSSEFVSIMGPSGCGKSTLLNLIGLLDQPTAGTILIHDTDVSGMSDREAARFRNKSLGFVFQNFHLVPSLNVMDNVELPLLYGRVAAVERKERVKEVLNMVGLSHRMKHFPSQLSGGQCQRVAIARAIVGHPEIILADEPTGNLDSRMGEEIMDILLELNELGVTVVMVTHDEHIASKTGRIVRLLDGKLV
ncbi:ABC transporter ATP-binding protein [Coprobacter fastidiosus]|jgi:putative ABC transport system ATP-binding protein|uniref:ABC transporter ATP-binding protein n=1 Tax=Coprobacter fastidiosus TaxID=1099853 RepID=UPI00307E612D